MQHRYRLLTWRRVVLTGEEIMRLCHENSEKWAKNFIRKKRIKKISMAPGKGFEPLRAKGPLAGLSLAQALFVPIRDLEASAITTPPPRLK
jgi:hypothetical protein